LWPNAIHALDRLGSGDAIRSVAMTARRLLIRSADGVPLSELDVDAVARSAGAPMVLIERRDLHRLLADGLDPPRAETVTSVDDRGVTLEGGERITAAATT
jgi:2-polyprenyl-6-methoxyphenol hydroxylase-like FAD-dependent oxidoreductase